MSQNIINKQEFKYKDFVIQIGYYIDEESYMMSIIYHNKEDNNILDKLFIAANNYRESSIEKHNDYNLLLTFYNEMFDNDKINSGNEILIRSKKYINRNLTFKDTEHILKTSKKMIDDYYKMEDVVLHLSLSDNNRITLRNVILENSNLCKKLIKLCLKEKTKEYTINIPIDVTQEEIEIIYILLRLNIVTKTTTTKILKREITTESKFIDVFTTFDYEYDDEIIDQFDELIEQFKKKEGTYFEIISFLQLNEYIVNVLKIYVLKHWYKIYKIKIERIIKDIVDNTDEENKFIDMRYIMAMNAKKECENKKDIEGLKNILCMMIEIRNWIHV